MQWVEASLHKLSSPAWMQTGVALKGFWVAATATPADGHPAVAYAWYRNFLQMMLDAQAYTWFAKVVAVSEMLIGVALILGVFVGLTAFFGGFMNWNFIMAGSASVNGMFFAIAVLLVLAWKIAGYFGLDYFLLPRVSALWSRSKAVQE
jgi:thiosulfate dehydrogenase [quinone] large subunit